MMLITLKNEICLECKNQMKACWCHKPKEKWDKSRLRFNGYDSYCLEWLEIDFESLKESLKESKDEDFKKLLQEDLKNYKEEIATAKKFLSGEYIEFKCVLCGFIKYMEPYKEVEWHCELCKKYNYLIKTNYEKYKYFEYMYYEKDFNENFIKCKTVSLLCRTKMLSRLINKKNKNKI